MGKHIIETVINPKRISKLLRKEKEDENGIKIEE